MYYLSSKSHCLNCHIFRVMEEVKGGGRGGGGGEAESAPFPAPEDKNK